MYVWPAPPRRRGDLEVFKQKRPLLFGQRLQMHFCDIRLNLGCFQLFSAMYIVYFGTATGRTGPYVVMSPSRLISILQEFHEGQQCSPVIESVSIIHVITLAGTAVVVLEDATIDLPVLHQQRF